MIRGVELDDADREALAAWLGTEAGRVAVGIAYRQITGRRLGTVVARRDRAARDVAEGLAGAAWARALEAVRAGP